MITLYYLSYTYKTYKYHCCISLYRKMWMGVSDQNMLLPRTLPAWRRPFVPRTETIFGPSWILATANDALPPSPLCA